MIATCARPGCGKPLEAKGTGRPGRFCSDACRNAARRAAAKERARDEHLPAPAPETRQRPSYGRDFGDGDRCPQDPGHGSMYFMKPTMATQWCPNSSHEGWPFYQRDGVTPAPRSGADRPEDTLAGNPGTRDQGLIGASTGQPGAPSPAAASAAGATQPTAPSPELATASGLNPDASHSKPVVPVTGGGGQPLVPPLGA